jgi:hypothetical protein
MELNFNQTMEEVIRTHGTLFEKMDSLVSGHVSRCFCRTEESTNVAESTLTTINSALNFLSSARVNPLSNRTVILIIYRMNRGVKRVPKLCREWHLSLTGCISVQEMELKYGVLWTDNSLIDVKESLTLLKVLLVIALLMKRL